MTNLAELAQERAENITDREGIDRDIAVEVRRVLSNGQTMAGCARILQMSRQGLYDLLRRHPRNEGNAQ